MQITVSNAAGLLRALKTARDGDVILLEPGTYSGVYIKGVKFNDVTIQSRNPDQPARLTDLTVRDSAGLNFADLEFVVAPRGGPKISFQVADSKDIHFKNLNVHGSLNGSPADDSRGLMIRNSTDVSITASEFHQLWNAIEHLDNSRLTISGNTFHDIRTDGIRGGGSSDVLIASNLFRDFYPHRGDHGDAVQFWTSGETSSARNITITDNVVVRGSGGIVQGIFLRDETEKHPYQNVTITDNLVVGAMYNGISVTGANNLTIEGNKVVSLPDMKSWIRVQDVTNGLVRGNEAADFLFIENGRVSSSANLKTGPVADGGASALLGWLTQHQAGDYSPAEPGPVAPQPPAPTPDSPPPSKSDPGPPSPKPEADPAEKIFLGGATGGETLQASDHRGGTHIDGRAGNDLLRGGRHDDFLIGNFGDDRLFGGGGADQFRFSGVNIDGKTDRDRIEDLDFSSGDTLVFNHFARGTFSDSSGVDAMGRGDHAIISSFAGIVEAASFSSRVTAFREAPGSQNLVLRLTDQDGQVQEIVIAGGYSQYLAAGGVDGL